MKRSSTETALAEVNTELNSGADLRQVSQISSRDFSREDPPRTSDHLGEVRRGRELIERGSNNHQAVRQLQTLLRDAGFRIQVDGDFGQNTENALITFQQQNGLTVDGRLGKNSLRALEQHSRSELLDELDRGLNPNSPSRPNTPPAPRSQPASRAPSPITLSASLLKSGMRGEEVRQLQLALNALGASPNLVSDGIFGPGTERAVQALQRSNNLAVDGQVGPLTRETINRLLVGGRRNAGAAEMRSHSAPPPARQTTPEEPKETYEDTFVSAMKHVFHFEGGINRSSADSGNAGGNVTNLGVTQGVYDIFRRNHGLAAQSTLHITRTEATELYHELYFRAAHANLLPEKSATVLFDTAINMGVGGSTLILQQTINSFLPAHQRIGEDGGFGTETQRALLQVLDRQNDKTFALKYLEIRADRYHQIARLGENSRFLRGWLNRVEKLRRIVDPLYLLSSTVGPRVPCIKVDLLEELKKLEQNPGTGSRSKGGSIFDILEP